MSNSAISFDATAKATGKQIYMIGRHFAQLKGESSQEIFGLSKIYPAVMLKWNAEHSETPITMGDIDTWKNGNKVPAKFTKMISVKKPKAKAAPKASPKPKATTKPKAQPKHEASTKPSEMPVGDFKDHFEKITGRVFRLEESIKDHSQRLSGLDAKLDIIMAYVTETPDSE